MVLKSFDRGITHFRSGQQLRSASGLGGSQFRPHHGDRPGTLPDELIISTKAGYLMWPGPYGEWGSRKYVLASLDQSLQRMGLEYVDIFYSHRFDPNTPLEETMGALETAVRTGRRSMLESPRTGRRRPARPAPSCAP